MAIVTYAYYTTTYGGAVAETQFDALEPRAEMLINALTGVTDYSSYPPSVETAVKNAVCAQVDYLDNEGMQVSLVGQSEKSYTIGKIRVDAGRTDEVNVYSSMICPLARVLLERTGLLYRAVPVLSDMRGIFV